VRASGQDDYIGTLVNKKYRVEEMIGEGGMGKVYRARQVALDKPVVLKVLHHTLLSDERTVARFQREARAASRLNHPNSINVLDFGQSDDGAMFIAMELVSGKDLHHILSREWPLPEARVARIVSQVLSALADAHGAGVIHRDLKPENIMIEQRRNEPDFVKVLDFGIAKIQDHAGDEGPTLTRAGFVCGTPEYMSPEQARGGTLDARSDLYAVGVILYQLMAGVLPFDSDSAVGFATKHLTEEPLPPTQKRPDAKISPGMESLILRALAKNPAERPQSADEFKQELLNLEEATELGRPSMAPRRMTRPPVSAAALARHATPPDQASTVLLDEPGWDEKSDTTVNSRPMKLTQRVSSGARAAGQPPLFWVKAAMVAVVALALTGLVIFLNKRREPAPAQAFVIAPAEPTVGNTPPNTPPSSLTDAYELQIPASQRSPAEANRLAREGDSAFRQRDLTLAAKKYREAFAKDPMPEFSLKLGEIHYQLNESQQAKGWWKRHLKDQTDSKARH
jgi:serine/threonine protein kinase